MKRSGWIMAGLVTAGIVALSYLLWKPGTNQGNYYRVLCMGDSLTFSDYGQYPRHLKRLFTEAGINAHVYAAARPGNTSGEYLTFLEKTPVLKKYNPHFLVLMLGTNDVRIDGDRTPLQEFEGHMTAIISRIKRHRNPDGSRVTIFVATIPPIFHCDLHTFDAHSKVRVDKEIVPAIHRLARKEGIFLIDLYSFFKEKPGLLPGIHPNPKGYRAIAEYIFLHLEDRLPGKK